MILHHSGNLYISIVTAWEIFFLQKRRWLELPLSPEMYVEKAIQQHGLKELVLERRTVQLSVSLPEIHQDPFDRALIAECIIRNMTLFTRDEVIKKYPNVKTAW